MKKFKEGNGQTKEIKMTKEQFEQFARKSCEWSIIPQMVYKTKADFMKKLDDERGKYMATLVVSRMETNFHAHIRKKTSMSWF